MAMMNTPRRGPEVADVTSILDSITPSSMPTRKLMPMMMQAITVAVILIAYSCCLSVKPFNAGIGFKKSSKVTVAKEFRIDTFKLQRRELINGI